MCNFILTKSKPIKSAEIFYTSCYHEKEFNSIDDIIKTLEPEGIQLVFDTNVFIYCRNLYTNRDFRLYKSILILLHKIQKHDLQVNYSLGFEESNRSASDFKFNWSKASESEFILNKVMNHSLQHLYERIDTQDNGLKKPKTIKTSTKQDAFNQMSMYFSMLPIMYCGVLKLYLLGLDNSIPSVKKYVSFIEFMTQVLDSVASPLAVLADGYFSNYQTFVNMLNTKGDFPTKLHNLWTVTIDLCNVYYAFGTFKPTPVLVTSDVALFKICDSIKRPVVIATGTNLAPIKQPVEVARKYVNWSKNDFLTTEEANNNFIQSRINRREENKNNRLFYLELAKKLEFELESLLKKSI